MLVFTSFRLLFSPLFFSPAEQNNNYILCEDVNVIQLMGNEYVFDLLMEL